jgi:hypothetical protein
MRPTREAPGRLRKLQHSAAVGLLPLFAAPAASPYSALPHEAIIDATWDSAIKPLPLRRFPAATAEELMQAHAFAYGGCIVQDLGYYFFGSKLSSDPTRDRLAPQSALAPGGVGISRPRAQ